MKISNPAVVAAFIFGLFGGGVLVHIAAPAPAQAQTASPAPMHSSMPAAGCPAPAPGTRGMAGQKSMQALPMMKSPADRAYLGAMMRMNGSMMRMTTTGNPDRDFMLMMIPHHQAAIEMSQTELQYGRDPKVKGLAKRIIAAQQAEIRQMQAWLK